MAEIKPQPEIEPQENVDEEKVFKTCDEDDAKNEGFFTSNGWKATFFIVLVNFRSSPKKKKLLKHSVLMSSIYSQVSLIIRSLIHAKSTKYNENSNEFLELVPDKYDDSELVEWEPAAAPISRPEEHGNLGISKQLINN